MSKIFFHLQDIEVALRNSAFELLFCLFFRLSYLHSKKIVHRDVKTENMLLDKTRTLKIADFGVARMEASNPNDMTGETGTLGYMAPEVFTWLLNKTLSLSLSLSCSQLIRGLHMPLTQLGNY